MIEHLRQIVVFAKTVEHGSFRKAAADLQLSPSVVSHHISQLEGQLGVALLYRSTRTLSLTSEGQALLRSAQAMVAAAEEFVHLASHSSRELFGHVNVTLPAFMEKSALIDHIGDFAKAYPKVTVNLDCSDAQREIIRDGIDLAIRMGRLMNNRLKAKRLGQIRRGVYASTDWLNATPAVSSPKDLEGLTWVGLAPVGSRYQFRHKSGKRQTINSRSQITVTNVQAVQQLLRNDNGVGVLPTFLPQLGEADGRLTRILQDWALSPIDVYAVWPANAPREGLTMRLVNFLAEKQVFA